MKRKKVLVTGGSGFVGKNLIDYLKSDYNVYSVSKSTKVKGVENVLKDLVNSDLGFLDEIKPQFVVWLATVSSPKQAMLFPQQSFDTNVTAIQKFLEYAKRLKLKKIVLLSSAVLYQDKKRGNYKESDKVQKYSSIYNYSKYLMETLASYYRKNHNLNITVFRLSNTYGPHQNIEKAPYLVPTLFKQAKSQKKIEIWNSKPVRDWVYVEDVVSVIEKEFAVRDSGVFNLGTGIGTSVGELANLVADIYGNKVVDLKKDVAPPYRIILDTKLLKKHLNFIPKTTVKDGIYKTHLFYNNA